MGIEKKEKAADIHVEASVDASTIDEIDEIMNEIEKLQKGMENSGVATTAATAPAVTAPATPAAASTVSKLRAVPDLDNSQIDGDEMKEFRGSGDDASMEETLGGMKEEDIGSGILDAAIAGEKAEADDQSEVDEQIAAVVEEEQAEDDPESDSTQDEEVLDVQYSNEAGGCQEQNGSLTMTLTGNMTLKLRYEFEGQEVTVGFSDNTLQVRLSDGTEFKIPLGRSSANLKAVA